MNQAADASIKKANIFLGLQFLSDFGDQITAALLAFCVLDISKSTSKVGLIYFISTIGFVVFTLLGGLIGDKVTRKKVLLLSDVGRGLTVLLMVIAVNEKSLLLIYITAFLLSTLSSIQRPSRISAWAENIPAVFLYRYNSFGESSIQISTIIGPLQRQRCGLFYI